MFKRHEWKFCNGFLDTSEQKISIQMQKLRKFSADMMQGVVDIMHGVANMVYLTWYNSYSQLVWKTTISRGTSLY